MRALVVYCHPRPESFTAAVRDVVLERLEARGAEIRLVDLYGEGFDPRLSAEEHINYEDTSVNQRGLETPIAHVEWCDTLLFVYPTWWYGLPAMLKGWLDRVLVPGVAFLMPDADNKDIRPGLGHIKRIGVFTTCGATWWLTRLVGAPGRRTILRGLRFICAKGCRTTYAAHYAIDSSTPESRAAHLVRVATKMDRFIGAPASKPKEAAPA